MLKGILVLDVLVLTHSLANSGELDLGYDSRYVSEGRNNLIEGGITWAQLSHELSNSLSAVSLYGAGKEYDELNFSLVYSQTYSDVDYYFSYTRLEFFEDNLNDNELGVGAAYSFLTSIPLSLAADAVYSVDAGGTFIEFSLESEITVYGDLTLSPYIKAGVDFGYASADKKGHNHSALGAVFSYIQSDTLSYNFSLEHSISRQHVKKESDQKNHSWFGFHIVLSY
jgi:hypothetical protein